MKKITISLDDELLTRIDSYASEMFMSRSGLITLACVQHLKEYEGIRAIKDISLAIQKIADTGEITVETMERLEDMKRVCKWSVSQN